MSAIFIRTKIPDGRSCMELPKKPCIFARYVRRMNGYNCLIHNKVLKGGEQPRKCEECLKYCKAYEQFESLNGTD